MWPVEREPSYEALFTRGTAHRVRLWDLRVTWAAFVVLLVLLGANLALWWQTRSQIRAEQEALFDRAVSSVLTRLERHIRHHEEIARSVQGLYTNFVQVVRDVFELYATVPARSNPAVLSVAYAPCVESEQLGNYLHYARSERYWEYRIFPSETVPYLFPLLYVVPTDSAPQWVEWNAIAHPAWRDAIERAYSTGSITATPWIPLRADRDTVWGFGLVAPIYRTEPHPFSRLRVGDRFVEGVIVLELAGKPLFQNALLPPAPTDSLIVFEGFDVQPASGEETHTVRIVASPNWEAGNREAPLLVAERSLRLGDRNLRLRFATVPAFEGLYQRWLPWAVLGGGIALSAIGFGFVLSLVTTRARPLALAGQMTRAQRRILEASQDIIAVWEVDGRWRTSNPALQAVLGFEPEELAGKPVEELVVPSYREQVRQQIASAPDEEAVIVEVPMWTKTGQQRWIGWNLTRSLQDGLIYAIGRDITAQKELQRQQEVARRQLMLAQQWALEASEFKADFLSRLGFQLRNGLTGLVGFAELIAQRQYASEEELRDYVAAIREGAEYLLGIVAETPEIAVTVTEQPVAVASILGELVAEAERLGIQLCTSIPSEAEATEIGVQASLFREGLSTLLQALSAGGVRGR
ncbi:MAG: CHASE domain-containing protein [Candidatus Kapabacteria bacterium]|nr:CHASE domain-containing protein [Candidatus Kapabacteria bacterium]MDW8011659.1 CHASE domain-containing protein [Bacteroidota bacterium]